METATEPRRHRPQRPPRRRLRPAEVDDTLLGGVAAAMALVKAHRTHGHLAARLDPLGSEPVGDPSLEPEMLDPPLTPELQARIPASRAARPRRGRDARRRAAAAQGDLLRDARVRDRAHLRPRGARLAAARDRVRPLPHEPERRREAAAARPPDRGRGHGAVPAPRVPRPEVVLRRGPGRDDPDARRDDRARGRGRRPPGRDRHGAPRAPQRARAHPGTPVRVDPARVRGRADAGGRRRRSRRRERRRQVSPRGRGPPRDELGPDQRQARRQPEPPRGGRPGRRGPGARLPDRPLDALRRARARRRRCRS